MGITVPAEVEVAADAPAMGTRAERVALPCERTEALADNGFVAPSVPEGEEVPEVPAASGFVAPREADALVVALALPERLSSASAASAPDTEEVEALDPARPLEASATALALEVEAAVPASGLEAPGVADDADEASAAPAIGLAAPSVGDVVRTPALLASRGFWAPRLAETLLSPPDCPDTPSSASTITAAETEEVPAELAATPLSALAAPFADADALTEAARESATAAAPCVLEVASLKARRGLAASAVA
jgi:hypothetical protein